MHFGLWPSLKKNEHGNSSGIVLIIIGVLSLMPMLTISATDNRTSQILEINDKANWRFMAENFTLLTFSTFRSRYICTKNLELMGKIGQPLSSLENFEYRPHLPQIDGQTLVSSDFVTGNMSLRNFLGRMQLESSRLKFLRTRSANTSLLLYQMTFRIPDGTDTQILNIKPTQLIMLTELDDLGNISGCQFSKYVQPASQTLIED